MKLSELAERLGCRLDGSGDLDIERVAGIEHAGPGDLTFFTNPRYTDALRTTTAAAVILGESAPAAPCAMLRTPHPYLAFAEAVTLFDRGTRPPAPGIDPHAAVAADVVLGAEVSIGPFVSIGTGARIGAGCTIYPNVCIGPGTVMGEHTIVHSHVAIRERSQIGQRVVIQNGAVIGSDGFGFARRPDGTHQKIPQIGIVVIEDDVEIGANTTIDRPALGETRIQAGAKIDNLVQIAHGVRVGRKVLLAAQVGIAGSTTIEDEVVLGGQVGVAGHITIGRRASASGKTGISKSVKEGAFVSGYPAIDNRDWLKASVIFRKLPELKKTIAALERRVEELEGALERAAGRAPR